MGQVASIYNPISSMSLSLAPPLVWKKKTDMHLRHTQWLRTFQIKFGVKYQQNIMCLTVKLSNVTSTFSKAQEENKNHKMATENWPYIQPLQHWSKSIWTHDIIIIYPPKIFRPKPELHIYPFVLHIFNIIE